MSRKEGQIIPKGPGRYQIRFALRRGHRATFTKTINCSLSEAKKELRRLLVERDNGLLLSPTTLLLDEWIDQWLTDVKAATARPKTLETYRDLAKRYIYPSFAGCPVRDITKVQIAKWVTKLTAAGLGPATIRHVFSVLHGSLQYLVDDDLLPNNPCKGVDKPTVTRPNVMPLNPEEARTLLAALPAEPLGALWGILLTAGLRPSEALALTWADVQEGRIKVERSLSWSAGGWSLGAPKTAKGYRSIPLDPLVQQMLAAHWERSSFKDSPNFVFCTAEGAPLNQKVLGRRQFPALLKRLGLRKIRLYDLRHTATTLQLLAGTSVTVLKERLGHKDAAYLLDTYTHVLEGQQLAATEAMSRLLHPPQGETSAPIKPST